MANKVLTFLQKVGADFEKGFNVADAIEKVALPYLTAFNPMLAAAISTTFGAVMTTEQKFAAMGKQNGTGTQKAAEVVSIVSPVLTTALAAAGKPSDANEVSTIVNDVVGMLNGLPAELAA